MAIRRLSDRPLRVVPELLGAELASPLRRAGYLHIPGSLGTALLDLWRDPNRRMPHDRVVNTAVVRVRTVARRGP